MSRFQAGLSFVLGCAIVFAPCSGAQTDYYNTDAGRPVAIEDAYPVEFRGIELQLAPLRLERARGGLYTWSIEPELAIGVLPRTQLELGAVFSYIDAGTSRTSGLAGVEISLLHNLNVETAIPALGVAAEVLVPGGGLAPENAHGSLKGILTKTFRWARFHVNGQYTVGAEPSATDATAGDVSRWLAGIAVDRTFPLQSLLLTAETFMRQPMHADDELEWNLGTGVRYQLDPRWALDGGVGKRLTGDERSWYATFGAAYALGLPWRR